jgi:hypothetical protein
MNAQNQEKALDSLRDWSKWLIGLNVVATTGCIVQLEHVKVTSLRPSSFLLGAVLLFVLSNLVAVLIVGAHAVVIQTLPVPDASGESASIFTYRVWRQVSLGLLARLQILLFGLGLGSLVGWVTQPPLVITAGGGVLLGLVWYLWRRACTRQPPGTARRRKASLLARVGAWL